MSRPGYLEATDRRPGSLEATDRPTRPDLAPPAPRPDVLKVVIVAVAVLVLAAPIALGTVLSKTLTSPAPPDPSASARPPSPGASGQAVAVSTLLTASAGTRTALHDAVGQVSACTSLPSAVSQLRRVVTRRTAESRQAATLPTAGLPDGTAVRTDLIAALGSSLTSDRDYLTWARRREDRGCDSAAQSAAYSAAVSASQRADAAKLTFVQVWNPVAVRYGVRKVSPDTF